MSKRKLLQWMREKLNMHADKVVLPAAEKKALDAAYKRAAPLVLAVVHKKYPPADMKILQRYNAGERSDAIKLQFSNGVVTEFTFEAEAGPWISGHYYRQIFLADAPAAAAVEKWVAARDGYKAERTKRLSAYKALIDGAGYVEDVIDMWPEAASILPAGRPPIPLGPEQIALVKADQRERKAA